MYRDRLKENLRRLAGPAEAGLDLLFPRRCPLCGKLSTGVCEDCSKKIVYVRQPFCFLCGRPLADEGEEYCASCRTYTRYYTAGRALCLYEGAVRESMHAVKYKNRREYLDFYAWEMAEKLGKEIRSWGVQALVPIPMYPSAKRRRGYNQAETLAKKLGRALDIPVCRALRKVKKTADQKGLNLRQRQQNLRGAFAVRDAFLGADGKVCRARVLLVDDIYTTGSTVNEAARTLRAAGAEDVYYVTICMVPENY